MNPGLRKHNQQIIRRLQITMPFRLWHLFFSGIGQGRPSEMGQHTEPSIPMLTHRCRLLQQLLIWRLHTRRVLSTSFTNPGASLLCRRFFTSTKTLLTGTTAPKSRLRLSEWNMCWTRNTWQLHWKKSHSLAHRRIMRVLFLTEPLFSLRSVYSTRDGKQTWPTKGIWESVQHGYKLNCSTPQS